MEFCWIKFAVFPDLKDAVHIGAISWNKENQGKIRLYTMSESSLKRVRCMWDMLGCNKEAGNLNLSLFSMKIYDQ